MTKAPHKKPEQKDRPRLRGLAEYLDCVSALGITAGLAVAGALVAGGDGVVIIEWYEVIYE